MLLRILTFLLCKFAGEEGKELMAMFFAQRVILGKASFTAVKGESGYIPPALRQKVADVLLESGLPEMVPTKYGGTMEEEEEETTETTEA